MTDPKLVIVVPWYGADIPGGSEAHARRLSEELTRTGAPVEVWSTCVRDFRSDWNHDFHTPGTTVENGVTVRRFRVRQRDTGAFDRVNAKLMRGIAPTTEEELTFLEENIRSDELCDAIRNASNMDRFLFLPYMFGTTFWGIRIRPAQSILQPCLHDESYAYLSSFRKMVADAHMIFCNTTEERALVRKIAGDDAASRVHIVGIGVDVPSADIRSSFFGEPIASAAPFLLYAGRKEEGKGVRELVELFASWKRRSSASLNLILAGPGEVPLPPDAQTLGIRDVGYLSKPDLHAAMARATALCQPSRNESFSIVMMESWLSGRSVIVDGRCEVTRGHCERSNGGLWYESQAEFNCVLDYVASEVDSVSRMGANGCQYVKANYSWEMIIARLRSLLPISPITDDAKMICNPIT